MNERHVELLALPVLLEPVREAEGFVELVALEHVEPTAQNNLPAMVSGDIPIVLGPGLVVLPGEVNTDPRTGVGHLLEIFGLTVVVQLIFHRQDMNRYFVLRSGLPADGLQ